MKKNNTLIDPDVISSILLILVIFFIQVVGPTLTDVTAPLNRRLNAERASVAYEEMQEEAEEDSFFTSVQPNLLLALSAAFTINFIVIMFYSRKKNNEDVEMMSGTCTHFEIKKPEIQ